MKRHAREIVPYFLISMVWIGLISAAILCVIRYLHANPIPVVLVLSAAGAAMESMLLYRKIKATQTDYVIPDIRDEQYCTRVAIALSRSDFLEKLLTTSEVSDETAKGYLVNTDFNVASDSLLLITLRIQNLDAYTAIVQSTDQQVLVRHFSKIIRSVTNCVVSKGGSCTFGNTQNDFVCLVGCQGEDMPAMSRALDTVLDRILRDWLEPYRLKGQVAFSFVETSYAKIPQMYHAATALFDYSTFVHLNEDVIHADHFKKADELESDEDSPDIRKLRATIQALIQQQRFDSAKTMLEEFLPLQFLSRDLISPFSFRISLFHFTTNFLKACDEALLAGGTKRLAADQYLAQLSHIATLDEYQSFLFHILGKLSSSIETGPAANNKWMGNALKYIAENASNPDLNASAVADYLELSLSHVTRVFQQELGCGVYEYIQSYRVGAATELLRKGYTISEIANTVGFSSVAAMNRAFKKFRGITPSKMNSKQEFHPKNL